MGTARDEQTKEGVNMDERTKKNKESAYIYYLMMVRSGMSESESKEIATKYEQALNK